MKKMKRFAALLLGLCMVVTVLAGCGKEKGNEDNEGNITTTGNTDTPGNTESPDNTNNPGNTGALGNTGSDYYGDIVLGQYKNVEVHKGQTEATEEEWESQVEWFLDYYAEAVPVEGKTVVENGDKVNIDYVGKIDGVAFDNGTAEGDILEIGSNQFIDGFEEQLIGAEIGETRDINVTFPENYQSTDLAGKDAVFTVTINAIVEFPPLTLSDEVIAKNTDYDTIEAYKEYMMGYITEQKTSSAEQQMYLDVFQSIIDDSEITNVPDDAVENMRINMNSTYESYASMYGLTLEQFINYYFGMSIDAYNTELSNLAEYRVKEQLILSEIIKLESITISDEEYQELLESSAAENEFETGEEFEAYYGKDAIMESFLMDKAYNIVVDTMIVIEYGDE